MVSSANTSQACFSTARGGASLPATRSLTFACRGLVMPPMNMDRATWKLRTSMASELCHLPLTKVV